MRNGHAVTGTTLRLCSEKRTVQANVEKFKYRWFWVLLNVVIQNLENRKKLQSQSKKILLIPVFHTFIKAGFHNQ